ncbi:MAG TPA: exodeoxyribonuclease III [Gammaproteobacteria bacterium]|jgi:exodeoxyribonuclease-3|nr:exodeoxyribonuclease III [Gammaproteobacteria bacterium]
MTFKIATWNVNSLRVRLPHVLQWLTDVKPDVLALQELKMPTEDFPHDAFTDAGYHAAVSGQRTYNGVAVISKSESKDIITDIPGLDDPQRRILAVTVKNIRIVDLYVPNGESVESDKYKYKLTWINKVDAFLRAQLKKHPEMVVLGDFNIAPANIDVYNPADWENSVLFSKPEREAFQKMLDAGFKDCFRELSPEDQSYSWWDYRMNAFRRNMGLRIDHILASKSLFAGCKNCHIDKEPRKWERPSDHAPVIAEFKFRSA